MTDPKPIVIISKCIEHDSCRWNGVMVASDIVRKLKPFLDFRAVCPEVEIGLGIPRKPIRVVLANHVRKLVECDSGLDFSLKMNAFTEDFINRIGAVDGFILKDRSPSCGYKDVKIYPHEGKSAPLTGSGSGFFGSAIHERFSHLAIENEGRLTNLALREHFLTRVYALERLRMLKENAAISHLIQFQAENKLLLMSYHQTIMRQMGKLVANHEKKSASDVLEGYALLFQQALSHPPRITSNINVLMHAMGYFSEKITSKEKNMFLNVLEKYRNRNVPLSVPNAVLKAWIVRFEEKYLAGQSFFSPYPDALMDMSDTGR